MSELSKEYKAAKATYDSWPQWKRDYADQWMSPQKEPEPSYPEAVDGDIYLNPFFGDMWIVDDKHFIKINDGYSMELDELDEAFSIEMNEIEEEIVMVTERIKGESKKVE